MPAVYVHTQNANPVDARQCSQSDTMALRVGFFYILVCLLHTVTTFAPNAPVALMHSRGGASTVHVQPAALTPTRRRASTVHVHPAALTPTRRRASAVPFVDCIGPRIGRAFEQTFQPATVRWLATTQALQLLSVLGKSECGVEVYIADFFVLQNVVFRLSVGVCSFFCNKMLKTGKKGAFVVAQVVLAAFVLCTGSNLPFIFTWHAVFERACVYTTALHVPALQKQAQRVAYRVRVYVRTLHKYLSPYRAFA
jgi:hypothetical protein